MSVPLHRAPRRSTRRLALWSIAALLAIALGALLAACGSSNSSNNASPSAGAAGKTTTVAGNISITSDPSLLALLPSTVTSANQIRVASDIPYPPWEMYVSAGNKQATGFDYDLSQAIGAKIGIPVSFNETPFDSIILSIKSGKNDMIMSDMYDNAQRETQGVSFVDYAYDGTSILVVKGNPKGITTQDTLAGQTVACESGTTQQAFLQKLNTTFKSAGKAQMTILALPNQPAALLAVKSGRAVGDLSDHSTVEYIAKTTNGGNTFEVVADPSAPNGYDPQIVGAGIVASNTGLITAVQKALAGLITDGSYAKIIAKYGLLPVSTADVNQGSKPVSASPSTSATP